MVSNSPSLFPEYVRKWPHPGLTTDLATRTQYKELDDRGNERWKQLRAIGTPIEIAQNIIYEEFTSKIFTGTDTGDFRPFGLDRVTYEETCDYIEKTWLPYPFQLLDCGIIHTMFQEIHKLLIDPQDPALKGTLPGKYRTFGDLFMSKHSKFSTLQEYLENKSKSVSTEKRKEFASILKECFKVGSHTLSEMVEKKLVSPKALEMFNEFAIIFPSFEKVPGLMTEMIAKIQAKILDLDFQGTFDNGLPLIIDSKIRPDILMPVPEDTISIAAFAHLEMVRVHPFVEGNGRMARLLMNIILIQGKLQPVAFTLNEPYTQAIRMEEAGLTGAFDLFLRKTIRESTKVPIYELQKNKTLIAFQ